MKYWQMNHHPVAIMYATMKELLSDDVQVEITIKTIKVNIQPTRVHIKKT